MTCKSAYPVQSDLGYFYCSSCLKRWDTCPSNVDPKDIPAGVGVIEFEVSTN